MLSNDIVLNNPGGVATTFKLLRYLPDGSQRRAVGSSAAVPLDMVIKHTASGKGADAVDRHLIQFIDTQADVAGNPISGTVNVSFVVPRNPNYDVARFKWLAAFVADLLVDGALTTITTQANVEGIINGES